MLIDHIFGDNTTLESVMQNKHEEIGGFPFIPYTSSIKDVRNGKVVALVGEGLIHGTKICITKNIKIEHGSPDMEINYAIRHVSGEPWDIWFGPEFNFAMLNGKSEFCKYYAEGGFLEDSCQTSKGESKDISYFGIENRLISTNIGLSFSEA